MKEPFLINPVKKMRKKKTGLPSGLLSRMIKKYGVKKGMKKAWEEYRMGIRSNIWPGDTVEHRKASLKGWKIRRKIKKKGYAKPIGAKYPRYNVLGEEVIVVGKNPRKKRKRRKNRQVNRNAWFGAKRAHARAARKGWATRRRYRRNPATALSIKRPMSLVVPIATGLVAKMATEKLPDTLNVISTPMRIGVQVGVMLSGNLLLKRFIGSQGAFVWTLVSGVTLATNLLDQYIFKKATTGYLPRYSYYPAISQPETQGGVSAFPSEVGMSAFPYGGEFVNY